MILLTVLMILLGSFYKLEEAIPTSLSRLSRPTIILDAGHGGEDGGAVGVDGIIEKDINLSIAQDLRDLLVMNGYTVVMTRDSDTAIYDPGMETLREKKVSDLENRLELMKEYPGSIFISIHQNQFGSPIYSGTQVFYSPNSQTSQELAQIIQETLDRGGNVVIPAFAVGRTQELLYFIRRIKEENMIQGHDGFEVYVDSPLAVEATHVFKLNMAECYDERRR